MSLSGGRLGGGGVEVGSSTPAIFNPPPHTTTRRSSLVSGAEADNDSMIHGDMGDGVRSSFGMEGGGGGHGGGSLFSAIIRSPNTPALSPRAAAATSHHFLSLIHISEPTRLLSISYAVFCLKKKKKKNKNRQNNCTI
eukprot:TRINITY_DN7885_c0_g2_i4.p1 TRINITY_DN7885_c0_g2~~TRINITY_DN7885_c0_g2_i4.p1  ORF type:complete len:138 (-),score=40.70 TRINITY_DN7885_c0_g2_i4:56-469(-)